MKNPEKFWDFLSDKTDNIAKKFETTYSESINRTKNYLTNNDIVLDFACGTGLICNEIAPFVKNINAIDISSKMIEIAYTKARNKQIDNILFEKVSIFNNKYDNQKFDVILAFNILHLVIDPTSLLARIKDLLKPNGFFISSTECAGENKKAFINLLVNLFIKIGIVPYMNFFKTGELEKLIKNGGFQIVETVSYYNHNQPNHFIVGKKDN